MGDIGNIALDESKTRDGVWVDWVEDIRLLLAPIGSEAFEQFVRKRTAKRARGYRRKDLDEKESDQVTREAIAHCVLLGWENIQENGEDLQYSPAKALELLSRPGLRHLYRFILVEANNEALFQRDLDEEEQGN